MSALNSYGLDSTACTKTMIKILTAQRKGLNICHINAQSLFPKMDEFRFLFEDTKMDIVCISETWFTKDLPDSFVNVNGYKVLRNDRKGRAGGVAVFIKNGIRFKEIMRSHDDEKIEYLFLEILGADSKLLLGTVYRPNSHVPFDSFLCNLESLTVQYDDIVIATDFNCNLLSNTRTHFPDHLTSIGLYIVNTVHPTHFTNNCSTLLDIFILGNMSKLLLFDQISGPTFSKHDLIYMSYDFNFHRDETTTYYRDFRHINYHSLEVCYNSIEWNNIYYMPSADEQLYFFNSNLIKLYDASIPLRINRGNSTQKGWFNSTIEQQIKTRDDIYRRWKRFRTPQLFEEYREARRLTNKTIFEAKTLYYKNRFRSAVDSKKKWQTIREIGIGSKSSTVCSMDVNELNESFVNLPSTQPLNTGQSNNSCEPLQQPSELPSLQRLEFTRVFENDVVLCCKSVTSNAVGFDLIHPKFVRILLPIISRYITHIFNTVITTSNFPKCWKYAKVIPVPKSSREYRPISILPFLSKVFERLIHNQISMFLNNHQLLFSKQSGFRTGHSCVTSLLSVSEDVRCNIDNGGITLLVLLDHSKAFDSVNHDILCKKIYNNFYFSLSATSLITTYLANRYQSVSAGEIVSTPLPVTKGVPQGSILGPLLFTLYINDLPSCLSHSNIHIYADDVQIYINCDKDSIDDCCKKLNEDLNKINYWASSNGLFLNPTKSKCLVIAQRNQNIVIDVPITLGNQNISIVESAKNLGIIFNKSLQWNTHINFVSGTIFSMLRTLYPLQHITPLNIRVLLAKTFLVPKLIYGCEIFASCDSASKSKIIVAFNAILRYVYGIRRFNGTSQYSKSLYGVEIMDLLKIKALILLHKVIYTQEPSYLFNRIQFARSSRGKQIIQLRYRTLISEWQFFTNSIRLWNTLPNPLQNNGNALQFRKLLFSHF